METKIEWADWSWNPYDWHCEKVSPGCAHCYAERHARELNKPTFEGAPAWRKNSEAELRKMPAGTVAFVNTHSDTYHKGATPEMVQRIHTFAVQRPDVIFLLLTKRPTNVLYFQRQLGGSLKFPDNLWLGVSVENPKYLSRLDVLRDIPVKHRFVSFEPLLGNITIDEAMQGLRDIDWAIVGGESGELHRPFVHEWAEGIYDACKMFKIPFFFKQSAGAYPGQERTFTITGKEHNERPQPFIDLHEKFAPTTSQASLF